MLRPPWSCMYLAWLHVIIIRGAREMMATHLSITQMSFYHYHYYVYYLDSFNLPPIQSSFIRICHSFHFYLCQDFKFLRLLRVIVEVFIIFCPFVFNILVKHPMKMISDSFCFDHLLVYHHYQIGSYWPVWPVTRWRHSM